MKVRLFVNAYGELTTDGYNPAYDKYDYEEDVARELAEFDAMCEYMGCRTLSDARFLHEIGLVPLDDDDAPLSDLEEREEADWHELSSRQLSCYDEDDVFNYDPYDDIYPTRYYGPEWGP